MVRRSPEARRRTGRVSRQVRFAAEASAELEDAARWYEQRHAGLGVAFLAAVDATTEPVVRWPRTGAPIDGLPEDLDVRRATVPRFPTSPIWSSRIRFTSSPSLTIGAVLSTGAVEPTSDPHKQHQETTAAVSSHHPNAASRIKPKRPRARYFVSAQRATSRGLESRWLAPLLRQKATLSPEAPIPTWGIGVEDGVKCPLTWDFVVEVMGLEPTTSTMRT
jgi:hypothetical protein